MTDEILVDPSNTDQLNAWNGNDGANWLAKADYFDRSSLALQERVLAAASIATDARVLDIGCGSGQSTIRAAGAAREGRALGVDLSAQIIGLARQRAAAAGVGNVTFEQADAQVHPFEADGFDVAISTNGAQFFGDLVAAFGNIGGALRPGGRVAFSAWQALAANEWLSAFRTALAAGRDLPVPPPDTQGPFALANPDRVRRVLTEAGFTNVELDDTQQAAWFGANADDASQFVLGFFGWMLDGLDDAAHAGAVENLHATLAAHETADGVHFNTASWIVTATHP